MNNNTIYNERCKYKGTLSIPVCEKTLFRKAEELSLPVQNGSLKVFGGRLQMGKNKTTFFVTNLRPEYSDSAFDVCKRIFAKPFVMEQVEYRAKLRIKLCKSIIELSSTESDEFCVSTCLFCLDSSVSFVNTNINIPSRAFELSPDGLSIESYTIPKKGNCRLTIYASGCTNITSPSLEVGRHVLTQFGRFVQ